jgi:hypothetical protein
VSATLDKSFEVRTTLQNGLFDFACSYAAVRTAGKWVQYLHTNRDKYAWEYYHVGALGMKRFSHP